MTSRALVRGQLYAVAAMAIWSTNYIAGRMLRDSVTPATIATFRALVASVPLAAWLVATRGWPRPARPVLGKLIALGFLGIFASQYMTYLALHWSLATNAIILNAASPLVTAGLAVAAGMFTFSPGLIVGLAISVVGAAIVTALGAGTGAEFQIDPGALLIIASMVTWGFYSLGVQRLSQDLPPLWLTAGPMLAGFPFLLGALAVEHPAHLVEAVRSHLPILLYLAVGPSAAAYVCWNVAVRDLGAAYATMFNNVLPIFGMLLGWLVLHERVTIVQVLAASLIIAGIVIAYRSFPMTSAAPRRSRAR